MRGVTQLQPLSRAAPVQAPPQDGPRPAKGGLPAFLGREAPLPQVWAPPGRLPGAPALCGGSSGGAGEDSHPPCTHHTHITLLSWPLTLPAAGNAALPLHGVLTPTRSPDPPLAERRRQRRPRAMPACPQPCPSHRPSGVSRWTRASGPPTANRDGMARPQDSVLLDVRHSYLSLLRVWT